MEQKIKKFITENNLLKDHDKVILGVSGGADSIALLNILLKLEYKVIVAHCNFHLRAEESIRDEHFVEALAKQYQVQFVKNDFETLKYAANNSISIEMAARKLRYEWFENLRLEMNAESIVVAHHKDDSVETVLMNLIRGTGIRGLLGIQPQVGKIIRPFLCVSRKEIEEYVKENQLDYVTDSSNRESVYTRNIIRLDVMPLLERINPSVKESIERSIVNLQGVEKVYNHYVVEQTSKIFKNNKIDITLLKNCIAPQSILYEVLNKYGFTSSTINDIYNSIDNEPGKLFYSEQYTVLKDREFFIIQETDSKDDPIYEITKEMSKMENPIRLNIDRLNINDINTLKTNQNILLADFDKLKYPLILRKWEIGDKFHPFGMKGIQKVSDYFSNNKLSVFEKSQTWLLLSGNEIVWIVGARSDDRFKVTNQTKKILRLELEN